MGELVGEFLSVDSRIGRTVVPFLVRPGFLAAEYNAGRRVHYSSPLRLLLFAVLLFVSTALLSVTIAESGVPDDQGGAVTTADAGEQVSFVDGLEKLVERRLAAVPDTDGIEAQLLTHIRKRVAELAALPPGEQSRQVRNALVGQFPKVAFFIIPLIAVLLQLLYVRQRHFFVEHLVFAAHFVAIALTLSALQSLIPVPGFALLGTIAHCLFGLRRVYGQGWVWTILKGGTLLFIVVITVAILSLVAIVLGLMLG